MKRSVRTPTPKIGIVVSQFNDYITSRLLSACLDELKKNKIPQKNISVHKVPGAFEIPVAALKLAKKKNIHAVICLGAVIRGETYHYELVADNAALGIMRVSLDTGKPVIMGVLSTDTVDQAYKRSADDSGNKGRDAALAALDMIKTLKEI